MASVCYVIVSLYNTILVSHKLIFQLKFQISWLLIAQKFGVVTVIVLEYFASSHLTSVSSHDSLYYELWVLQIGIKKPQHHYSVRFSHVQHGDLCTTNE